MGIGDTLGRIVVQAGGPVSVVALRGEHDDVSKSQLEGIVETLLRDASTRAVVVDLSDTDFVNLPVIGALARATNDAADRGKHLVVVLPETAKAIVRRLFELVETDRIVHVVPTMQDAVKVAASEASR
jgi:anti-anti-sigma factor